MECNKEEAIRAKEIAEKKMQDKEFVGARKIVLKAQQLYPNLENISQMMTVCEVHCSAENKVLGTEMDWYGILQIDQTADEASMKKQYRKLALLLHPDKNKFPGAEAAFKLIGEAHRLLSDPAKRAVFDARHRASLRSGPQRQSQPQPCRNNYVKKQSGVHVNFVSNAPTQFTSMNPHQMKQQAQPGIPNGQQTFWTVCPFCSIKYQYYRDIVNRALRCQSCAKPFIAYDLEAQGVPSGPNNHRPTPQQKQVPDQGGSKKGTESTAGNFPSSMRFQGNLGNKQARSDSLPSRKTVGTSEVGGASKTKKEEDGNVQMEDVKEGKDMPKSEAGNSTEQKSSGNKDRKRGRDSGESSESCDTGSSMDSEEDEVLEENGVHPTGSTGDHYVRRSCRQKQQVKYNEDASDDDDTVNRAKRAKVNGSPEASREQSGSILKDEAKTDPSGCSTVFGEEKKVEKRKEMAPLEESLRSGNDVAEACKNIGKEAAAMDDKKEGSRVDNESESSHEKKSDPDVLVVLPDPEFFDFDKDKKEECFAVDQMWAVYDDLDGMPRFYARIRKVYSPFKLGIFWLKADLEVQDEIDWFQEELPVACGKFKNEKTDLIDDISTFSHRVDWEKGTSRGSYKIYPRRGETWALFKNWNIHWSSNPDNHRKYEYEFVEVLSDFTPESGIRVGYLVKLKGFVSLFKSLMKNGMASFEIPRNELFRFSHRIPSFRTSGTEREDVPKGYWELDPASLPGELEGVCDPSEVKVNIESLDVKSNGSSKSPSTKSGNSTPRKSNRCHQKPNEENVNHCEDKTSTGPDLVKERRFDGPTSDKETESTCQADSKKLDSEDSKHASPNKVAGDQIPGCPSCTGPSKIPDTEFHDFGIDKFPEKFQPGQIWAVYCDLDTMPKFYAQINSVELSPDFKLHATWLDSCRLLKCIQWFDKEMPVSCGMFKLGELQTFTDANNFSHQLRSESTRKKNNFEIYPRKGEVWAIYKNSNSEWTLSDLQKCEYDIVEVLAHDSSKTKVVVLEKVTGFWRVFKAKKKSEREFITDDLITFSHQIPAFRLTEEGNGSLRDCWELDHNSMPAEVKVNIEPMDVKINGSSKSPSIKSGNSTPRKPNRCHKKPNEENVNHCEDKNSTAPELVEEGRLENKSALITGAASGIGRTCNRHCFDQFHDRVKRLENKIALITGAASGIGKATATEFIKHGAKVIIAGIQNQLGQETASELGPNATFIHCNVVKESDVSAAVDFAVSKHGHLDIMYNNAGISGKTPPSILDLNLEDFDRVMNINVRGVLTGIKHAARVMIPRRTGCILCTASDTGVIGGPAPHAYSISKSTVVGMVRSMASELRKYGVRVNCISPFAVPTPFVMDDMVNLFPGVEASHLVETVQSTGALEGANCESIDVAKAAVYLASDEAKYVSGHNLVVDGGFSSFKILERGG